MGKLFVLFIYVAILLHFTVSFNGHSDDQETIELIEAVKAERIINNVNETAEDKCNKTVIDKWFTVPLDHDNSNGTTFEMVSIKTIKLIIYIF